MKCRAGKSHQPARVHDHRNTQVIAAVPHQILRSFIAPMLHEQLITSRPRLDVDRSILLAHVIQCAPGGQVGAVGLGDISRVLVPAELHAHLGTLDDVLVFEEVRVWPDGRATDVGHVLTKDVRAEFRPLIAGPVDKVPLTLVRNLLDVIGPAGIDVPIRLGDQVIANISKQLDVFRRDVLIEDEVPLIAKLSHLIVADLRLQLSHETIIPEA